MNIERVSEILNRKQLCEVFYNDQPVWIQEIRNNVATIGFLNGASEKDVFIEDLYETK